MADPKPKPGNDFLAQILKNAKAKPAAEVAKAGLETRFCSACGANREEGSDLATCAYCGASFREDRRCPRCSAPVKSRAATQCEQCGERL
jgi:predicted amidophosphoribosyltransferase